MLGVIYAHQVILKTSKKMMFLLVISSSYFGTPDHIYHTLYEFVSRWNYDAMTEETKSNMFKSIGLVITRSNKEDEEEGCYIEQLQNLLGSWRDPNFTRLKKEQCLEILKFILDRSMIGYFTEASNNKQAPTCTLLSDFESKGLRSFDVAEARKSRPGLIANQLPDELAKLKPEHF